MQFLTTLLPTLALLASTTTVTASSIAARSEAAVITPRITSPQKGDVWEVKSQQLVTWDTSDIPSSGVDDTGSIVLTFDDDGSESSQSGKPHPPPPPLMLIAYLHLLHADRWHTLAEEFLLMNGEQTIIVPDMPYGTTYFLYRKSLSCSLA
jgi:hypothetical protein